MSQLRDDEGSPGTGQARNGDRRDALPSRLERGAHFRTICDIAQATAMERGVFAREGRRAVRESREAIGEADKIIAERPRIRPAEVGSVTLAADQRRRPFIEAARGAHEDGGDIDAAARR